MHVWLYIISLKTVKWDEPFDKCDEDEEYMSIPLCHRDSRLGDEEGAMNYFRDQIVNACTVCKENLIYFKSTLMWTSYQGTICMKYLSLI
jgi:hypothetical protein